MKKLITTAFCAFALYNAEAKIWRLNSDLATNADFRSLQTAHDDAKVLNGDTLHLEGATISYGDLTCTKKLFIVGTGTNLGANGNLQNNSKMSLVGNILFNSGSEYSQLLGLSYISVITNNVSYISIYRCSGGTISIGKVDHNTGQYSDSDFININGCRFYELVLGEKSSGILVLNNIIRGVVNSPVSATFNNNVIGNLSTLNNCFFNNNIFIAPGSVYNRGNSYQNNGNRFNNNVFPNIPTQSGKISDMAPGANNQFNVDLNTVFIKVNNDPQVEMFESDYTLKVGSPAIGAGVNGVDCGIFGGSTPYVLSGIPAIPTIYNISLPAASTDNTLKGTISTKSNK